eukprot:1003995-Amorphochlora_amoeboformis.AAC.1
MRLGLGLCLWISKRGVRVATCKLTKRQSVNRIPRKKSLSVPVSSNVVMLDNQSAKYTQHSDESTLQASARPRTRVENASVTLPFHLS